MVRGIEIRNSKGWAGWGAAGQESNGIRMRFNAMQTFFLVLCFLLRTAQIGLLKSRQAVNQYSSSFQSMAFVAGRRRRISRRRRTKAETECAVAVGGVRLLSVGARASGQCECEGVAVAACRTGLSRLRRGGEREGLRLSLTLRLRLANWDSVRGGCCAAVAAAGCARRSAAAKIEQNRGNVRLRGLRCDVARARRGKREFHGCEVKIALVFAFAIEHIESTVSLRAMLCDARTSRGKREFTADGSPDVETAVALAFRIASAEVTLEALEPTFFGGRSR